MQPAEEVAGGCVKCGEPLETPRYGRAPIYCSESCRSLAASEIRRLNQHLVRLEKQEIDARMRLKTRDFTRWNDEEPMLKKRVKFLQAEAERIEARLRELQDSGGTSPHHEDGP
jgi:hypothetical protein